MENIWKILEFDLSGEGLNKEVGLISNFDERRGLLERGGGFDSEGGLIEHLQ